MSNKARKSENLAVAIMEKTLSLAVFFPSNTDTLNLNILVAALSSKKRREESLFS